MKNFICLSVIFLCASGAVFAQDHSPSGQELLSEGIKAYYNNDALGAIDRLTQFLIAQPTDPQARRYINLLANDPSLTSATRIRLLILSDLLIRMDHFHQNRLGIAHLGVGATEDSSRLGLEGFIEYLDREVAAIQRDVAGRASGIASVLRSETVSVSVEEDGGETLPSNFEGPEHPSVAPSESTPPLAKEFLSLQREVSDLQAAFELNQKILFEKDQKIDTLENDLENLRKVVKRQEKEFRQGLALKDAQIEELAGILQIYKAKLTETTQQLRGVQIGNSSLPDRMVLQSRLEHIHRYLSQSFNFD